ncbi:uncharacterized protein LOC117642298 isoform X2 [Thrips palmi]|uniref:Uncharacterized protein LOC117642298 isoform X2 n=1 Tax=Thrips palmi TaxID=161013 RepID=A0A6P8Y990_THRPL|nr:uncharacterized protein LOC117642298 isoform X2 [Thrips palmi]
MDGVLLRISKRKKNKGFTGVPYCSRNEGSISGAQHRVPVLEIQTRPGLSRPPPVSPDDPSGRRQRNASADTASCRCHVTLASIGPRPGGDPAAGHQRHLLAGWPGRRCGAGGAGLAAAARREGAARVQVRGVRQEFPGRGGPAEAPGGALQGGAARVRSVRQAVDQGCGSGEARKDPHRGEAVPV